MHLIEMYIQKWLEKVNAGECEISEQGRGLFEAEAGYALAKQFGPTKGHNRFTMRMSNIGRPLCQLQSELLNPSIPDTNPIRNLYGDLVEDILSFILHAAGVPIIAEQKEVHLEIGGIRLAGHLDFLMDFGNGPEVWDAKSASGWAFRNKFELGWEHIFKEDNFGYADQLFLYAEAERARVGGFIVFDKSSGEVGVVPVPQEQETYREQILRRIDTKIRILSKDDRFRSTLSSDDNVSSDATTASNAEQLSVSSKRDISRSTDQQQYTGNSVAVLQSGTAVQFRVEKQFRLEPEVFGKKKIKTGKLMLAKACSFCPYKFDCWKDVTYEACEMSKSQHPKFNWYAKGEK